jgi:predicted  nucleic acid-binding Zn-ribbon protein
MSQERIDYLDRMITKLRDEQSGLMDEHEQLEKVICEYEREADALEALVNEESYGGTSND